MIQLRLIDKILVFNIPLVRALGNDLTNIAHSRTPFRVIIPKISLCVNKNWKFYRDLWIFSISYSTYL